jgi:hypothetical protein
VKSEEQRVFNSELSVRLKNGVGVSGRHSEQRAPRVATPTSASSSAGSACLSASYALQMEATCAAESIIVHAV